jgi:hypothetical protein
MFFLQFFLDDVTKDSDPDPGGPKHTDPTDPKDPNPDSDPDLQHCISAQQKLLNFFSNSIKNILFETTTLTCIRLLDLVH